MCKGSRYYQTTVHHIAEENWPFMCCLGQCRVLLDLRPLPPSPVRIVNVKQM